MTDYGLSSSDLGHDNADNGQLRWNHVHDKFTAKVNLYD